MHIIFAKIPSLISSDLILFILPALTISILFFSLKIMFYDSKIKKVSEEDLRIIIHTAFLHSLNFDNRLFFHYSKK